MGAAEAGIASVALLALVISLVWGIFVYARGTRDKELDAVKEIMQARVNARDREIEGLKDLGRRLQELLETERLLDGARDLPPADELRLLFSPGRSSPEDSPRGSGDRPDGLVDRQRDRDSPV